MSTLFIRLPARASAESAAQHLTRARPFALVAQGGAIERQGAASLENLSAAISQARRTVLLLAACDVTLMRVQAPPVSPAKLKLALPSLVEDRLVCDPAECVIVAGSRPQDGWLTVAIAQRLWLEFLMRTLVTYGARRIALLPAQLCLPLLDHPVAAIDAYDSGNGLTLRLSEQEGVGMLLAASSMDAVQQALHTLVPDRPVTLLAPQGADITPDTRIDVVDDDWSQWISGANHASLDLTSALGMQAESRFDWKAWRWVAVLAMLLVAVNLLALNIKWWGLKHEADGLRSGMTDLYKSAYPRESVIIDPVAQFRQKIGIARRKSGMSSPDDFTEIVNAFGAAWKEHPANGVTITTLEYRDRTLYVRLKAGSKDVAKQLQTTLARYNLTLDAGHPESGTVVWKIRSAR